MFLLVILIINKANNRIIESRYIRGGLEQNVVFLLSFVIQHTHVIVSCISRWILHYNCDWIVCTMSLYFGTFLKKIPVPNSGWNLLEWLYNSKAKVLFQSSCSHFLPVIVKDIHVVKTLVFVQR